MKVKELIEELKKLDGEKIIAIYDYEEDKEDLNLAIIKNNFPDCKSDYLIDVFLD